MFVAPTAIGKGIGRLLFSYLLGHCQAEGINKVHILADPHSAGFYEKMRCLYQEEKPSTIANRTTLLYIINITMA